MSLTEYDHTQNQELLIKNRLGMIQNNSTKLEKTVETLRDRLRDILLVEYSKKEETEEKDVSDNCPLSEELRLIANTVSYIEYVLDDILKRLQI